MGQQTLSVYYTDSAALDILELRAWKIPMSLEVNHCDSHPV